MAWWSQGCRDQRRGVTDRNDVWVSRRTAGGGRGVESAGNTKAAGCLDQAHDKSRVV